MFLMKIRGFIFFISILFLVSCQDVPANCRRDCREKLANCFALDTTVSVDAQSRLALTCYLADALCESDCDSPGGATRASNASVRRNGSSSGHASGSK
ncbi:putative lipoprotein [Leptospira inadai serovar Lyme str. 10]|nr:putative lipoprotein [Leptospira inadai serovar Lyme str. 10]